MRISDWSSDVCSSDLADSLLPVIDGSDPRQPDNGMFGCDVLAMCGDRDGAANRRRVHDRTAAPRFQHCCDLMFHAMKNAEHVDIQGSLEIGARQLMKRHVDRRQPRIVECAIKATEFGDGEFHGRPRVRSEEHTSELQSLMRISYAVFCLKKKKKNRDNKEN